MTKEIVWSIGYGEMGMVLKTKSKNVDKEDEKVTTPSVALILAMKRLSKKYCNRGYAVLFYLE